MKTLILDAMGVIYAEGDDGPNLLYPFIVEKGGNNDVTEVIRCYTAASLGQITSAEFWKAVGLDPALEDEYLLRYRLSDGLMPFLEAVSSRGIKIWCLSNDVSEWSKKLRVRFGLERYFRGFIISGDAGVRKPDCAIYEHLMEKAGIKPSQAFFVDDRLKNIIPADELGFAVILFNPTPQDSQGHTYKIVRNFSELLAFL